jgi:hypothetical protein
MPPGRIVTAGTEMTSEMVYKRCAVLGHIMECVGDDLEIGVGIRLEKQSWGTCP